MGTFQRLQTRNSAKSTTSANFTRKCKPCLQCKLHKQCKLGQKNANPANSADPAKSTNSANSTNSAEERHGLGGPAGGKWTYIVFSELINYMFLCSWSPFISALYDTLCCSSCMWYRGYCDAWEYYNFLTQARAYCTIWHAQYPLPFFSLVINSLTYTSMTVVSIHFVIYKHIQGLVVQVNQIDGWAI